MNLSTKKIVIFGQDGLVGKSLFSQLKLNKFNVIDLPRKSLDLKNTQKLDKWFNINRPQVVFVCAGKVGGIQANNNHPVDFLVDNSLIAINTITASNKYDVEKLIYLGSSCIYPKDAKHPILEEYLLTGKLEKTNEPYAISKILGIKLCQAYQREFNKNFISAMPTNLYGPNDKYHITDSHVIPSLILKIYLAKINSLHEVNLLGTGSPLREFLYIDDLSRALIFIAENYNDIEHINLGSNFEINIKELTSIITKLINYDGDIKFSNNLAENGTSRKLIDSSKLRSLGWKPEITFEEGIQKTYDWFLRNIAPTL